MTVTNLQSIQEIDAATLKNWLDEKKVNLVDVREPVEYAGEHIPGAKLVSLSQFNPEEIKLLNDKQIVLYCQSSNRSGKSSKTIIRCGF